jgi:hypothetical protein
MSRRVDSVHRDETEQEQHMGGTYIRAPTVTVNLLRLSCTAGWKYYESTVLIF